MSVVQLLHPASSSPAAMISSVVHHQKREAVVQEIIENNLTSHFQPIVSLDQGKIFAYEALCRTVSPNPFDSIEEIFGQAKICNKILELDMRCRENGIALSCAQGIKELEVLLFLNICPTSLLCPNHTAGTTGILANSHGMPKQSIVLEITEQEAVSNYTLFRKAVDHYRSKGFRIAIDDFGAGYGGLKMLSVLEPDFVKIDRHGFEMGDRVIKAVGDIMLEALKKWETNSIGFAGHIGGDDFILITRPRNSIPACEYIIEQFTRRINRFHTPEECRQGSYRSCDRQGNTRKFDLLSLSIGIVSTEIHHISSFAEVSSIASDLKKRAKEMPGSAIVRDRRIKIPEAPSNVETCEKG